MSKRHHWTDADRATLRALYPEFSAAECAAAIGCSVSSINNQAHALGLRKSREWIARRAAERSARPDHGGRAHQFRPGHATWNKGREREQLRAKLDELTADRDEIHRALLMTTDERNRGDRELHRLRAQLDEYERAPQPPHVDPDWLSNVIRTVAPHICAERDELAEKIAEAINARAK